MVASPKKCDVFLIAVCFLPGRGVAILTHPTFLFWTPCASTTLRQGSSSAFVNKFAPMASLGSPQPKETNPVGAILFLDPAQAASYK